MLYLTYNNTAHTDGAGAQLQRILCIYLCAKHSKELFGFQVGYIHTPLLKLDYQGLQCLETNSEDHALVNRWNENFNIPSDPLPVSYHTIETSDLLPSVIRQYRDYPEDILFKVTYAHRTIDAVPSILQTKISLPWLQTTLQSPLKIAVHVRRGELMVVESARMLPNSYYIQCLQSLIQLLTNFSLPFEIHLHTEVPTKAFEVTPTHHGILERIPNSLTIDPSQNRIEEFNVIPNLYYHINEDPIKTLQDLTNSDILLASRSSFSYVAGILKPKGAVLFHPFWHGLSPDWIPIKSAADIVLYTNQILKKILG
jgi:hypothetical protein